MSKTPAALRASSWSFTHGHIVLSLKNRESDQFFINTPVTSYPSSFNNAAATEESTPPLIATKTFRLPSCKLALLWGCFDLIFIILVIYQSSSAISIASSSSNSSGSSPSLSNFSSSIFLSRGIILKTSTILSFCLVLSFFQANFPDDCLDVRFFQHC